MSPIGWSGWNRAGPRRSGRPRCSRRTRSAPRAWERRWRWCGGRAASPGPTRSPSTTRCDCGGTGDQRAKARAGVVRVRRRHGAGRGLVRARPGRAGGAARPQRCGQIDARAARDRSAPARRGQHLGRRLGYAGPAAGAAGAARGVDVTVRGPAAVRPHRARRCELRSARARVRRARGPAARGSRARPLGLEPHAAHHPYDLPPAFRKLAALAGALALEPRLLVLDEPTAGLDRALRARVASALLERAAAGAALLVVTHDLAFAAETLERALVLDRGRLACDEPLAGLLAAPPRLEPLGLAPPAVAALSRALGLPGAPVREADAARALARVAAGRRAPLD